MPPFSLYLSGILGLVSALVVSVSRIYASAENIPEVAGPAGPRGIDPGYAGMLFGSAMFALVFVVAAILLATFARSTRSTVAPGDQAVIAGLLHLGLFASTLIKHYAVWSAANPWGGPGVFPLLGFLLLGQGLAFVAAGFAWRRQEHSSPAADEAV